MCRLLRRLHERQKPNSSTQPAAPAKGRIKTKGLIDEPFALAAIAAGDVPRFTGLAVASSKSKWSIAREVNTCLAT